MALTVHLMRIMFPTVVMLGIAGVLMGILNSYNRFTMPAMAPIVWNLVIIAVMVVFAGYGVKALAWGVLAGTVVEVLMQVPPVWRLRWRRRQRTGTARACLPRRRTGPEFGAVPKDALALAIWICATPGCGGWGCFWAGDHQPGHSQLQLSDRHPVASFISVPAPAFIEKAFRLFQLPQGVFAIAIGTVLFPSAVAPRGRPGARTSSAQDLSQGIRQIFFVTLPFAALFAVLALPTVRLVYEHGAVRGNESALTAWPRP